MVETSTASVADVHRVAPENRPQHIAVIMDGNGRWAQRQGLPRIEGHRHGVASVRRTVEECARLKIPQLTLFCLSSENWKRPQPELDFLMHLLEQYMIEERTTIMEQQIAVSIIGRRDGIPDGVLREIDKTLRMSAANRGTRLCLAVNYGGRAEMLDAVRRIARDVAAGKLDGRQLTEKTISDYLYTRGMPDPDRWILTPGERRLGSGRDERTIGKVNWFPWNQPLARGRGGRHESSYRKSSHFRRSGSCDAAWRGPCGGGAGGSLVGRALSVPHRTHGAGRRCG